MESQEKHLLYIDPSIFCGKNGELKDLEFYLSYFLDGTMKKEPYDVHILFKNIKKDFMEKLFEISGCEIGFVARDGTEVGGRNGQKILPGDFPLFIKFTKKDEGGDYIRALDWFNFKVIHRHLYDPLRFSRCHCFYVQVFEEKGMVYYPILHSEVANQFSGHHVREMSSRNVVLHMFPGDKKYYTKIEPPIKKKSKKMKYTEIKSYFTLNVKRIDFRKLSIKLIENLFKKKYIMTKKSYVELPVYGWELSFEAVFGRIGWEEQPHDVGDFFAKKFSFREENCHRFYNHLLSHYEEEYKNDRVSRKESDQCHFVVICGDVGLKRRLDIKDSFLLEFEQRKDVVNRFKCRSRQYHVSTIHFARSHINEYYEEGEFMDNVDVSKKDSKILMTLRHKQTLTELKRSEKNTELVKMIEDIDQRIGERGMKVEIFRKMILKELQEHRKLFLFSTASKKK